LTRIKNIKESLRNRSKNKTTYI